MISLEDLNYAYEVAWAGNSTPELAFAGIPGLGLVTLRNGRPPLLEDGSECTQEQVDIILRYFSLK